MCLTERTDKNSVRLKESDTEHGKKEIFNSEKENSESECARERGRGTERKRDRNINKKWKE